MWGLHFRHLADGLQRAATDEGTAALAVVSAVPALIHFVFWVDTVARCWRQVS